MSVIILCYLENTCNVLSLSGVIQQLIAPMMPAMLRYLVVVYWL